MELLTILLSGLLGLLSPVGLVTDKIIEGKLRSRLSKVEQLQVRVDNTPNYQLLQGKVDRVRIAGRGLWLRPNIRIGALEVETDPVSLDLQRLRQRDRQSPVASLRQPLQAGLRLVLTENDLNQTLQSPAVAARLRAVGSRLLGGAPENYEVLSTKVDFLSNNRLRFQVELRQKGGQPQAIALESGFGITAGHKFQLIEPAVSINGKALSPLLIAGFSAGLGDRLDLRSLEERGITARVLQFKIDTSELEVAAFVRVDPSKQASAKPTGANRP